MAHRIIPSPDDANAPLAWIDRASEWPMRVGQAYELTIQVARPESAGRDFDAARILLDWITSSDTVELLTGDGASGAESSAGDERQTGEAWMNRFTDTVGAGRGPVRHRLRVIPRCEDDARVYVVIYLVRSTPDLPMRELYRRFSIDLPILR